MLGGGYIQNLHKKELLVVYIKKKKKHQGLKTCHISSPLAAAAAVLIAFGHIVVVVDVFLVHFQCYFCGVVW